MRFWFNNIIESSRTIWIGLTITIAHLWQARKRRHINNIQDSNYFGISDGMVTLQYPFETMPIPDNGRYRLYNEMDDCIVCDKCAKVCPVNCIEIEPIKATAEVGRASDGSPIRLYAAKFDIDMAKCCYCGLCTTVCPTECLTMTKTFDYSEFNVRDMNYHYANLSPQQAQEKRELYEQFVKEKELQKQNAPTKTTTTEAEEINIAPKKPVFKPTIKPPATTPAENVSAEEKTTETAPKKPVFKPTIKPPTTTPLENIITEEKTADTTPKKPVFKPTIKPPIKKEEE